MSIQSLEEREPPEPRRELLELSIVENDVFHLRWQHHRQFTGHGLQIKTAEKNSLDLELRGQQVGCERDIRDASFGETVYIAAAPDESDT